VANAAKAVLRTGPRFGSKRLPPPGFLTEGQMIWMIYCEASTNVHLKSNLIKIEVIEGDVVPWRGNGVCDQDHPIPRALKRRSNESMKTFEKDNGRSIGRPFRNSYLLNGLLVNVRSIDISATTNIAAYNTSFRKTLKDMLEMDRKRTT
jgi:hypothetical protein